MSSTYISVAEVEESKKNHVKFFEDFAKTGSLVGALDRYTQSIIESMSKEYISGSNKGDIEKVQDLIKDLSSITTKFEFESKVNKGMYKQVDSKVKDIIKFILS